MTSWIPWSAAILARFQGGFTLQLQQLLAEDFGRGAVVGALVRGDVVQLQLLGQPLEAELAELQTARPDATQAADRVFHPALLPGRVGVAPEGLNPKTMQRPMLGELGAVVEVDHAPQGRRSGAQQ